MQIEDFPDKETYFLEICLNRTFRKEITREELIKALESNEWKETDIYKQEADILIDWVAVDDIIL